MKIAGKILAMNEDKVSDLLDAVTKAVKDELGSHPKIDGKTISIFPSNNQGKSALPIIVKVDGGGAKEAKKVVGFLSDKFLAMFSPSIDVSGSGASIKVRSK